MRWDPAQYARYARQRNQPFFDLVAQIRADAPAHVVDLGCGSGDLTATLTQRWPGAAIRGIDSSPEMIERASGIKGVDVALGTAQSFDASGVDVVISNAMLQWVRGHVSLLTSWAGQLNDGGWLAFQVPANFDAPSHRLMRELAASETWRGRLPDQVRGTDTVLEPTGYLDLLIEAGLAVEVWQTEYFHVLSGDDPVLEWVRGTGLRPILAALSPQDAAEFSVEYASLLRDAYPPRTYGTVFPFLRTFVVAHKA